MRRGAVVMAVLAAALMLCGGAAALAARLLVQPKPLAPGQPAVVRVELGKTASAGVRAEFMGKRLPLWRGPDGAFLGLVAPDLGTKPGKRPLRVLVRGRQVVAARVMVGPRDYGERRITVKKKFMVLSKEQLKRHWAEMARQKAVYNSYSPQRLWRGAWQRPVPGKMVGPFGRRSVINGEPRSPHGGVDLRAGLGEPVRAANAGRVALVDPTYFGGLTMLIDHGQGVISGYRHLSKSLVTKGQTVAKGQVIALAGKSGRVTGPHLHFDLHLAGSRVDPLAFIAATNALAARSKGD